MWVARLGSRLMKLHQVKEILQILNSLLLDLRWGFRLRIGKHNLPTKILVADSTIHDEVTRRVLKRMRQQLQYLYVNVLQINVRQYFKIARWKERFQRHHPTTASRYEEDNTKLDCVRRHFGSANLYSIVEAVGATISVWNTTAHRSRIVLLVFSAGVMLS